VLILGAIVAVVLLTVVLYPGTPQGREFVGVAAGGGLFLLVFGGRFREQLGPWTYNVLLGVFGVAAFFVVFRDASR
jgi:hypothetical protein